VQTSERQLRLLVDSFPGMISVANADGWHEYANQRVLDFLGQESIGTTGWADYLHPDDTAAVVAEWFRCTSSGQPLDITYRLRRFDGVYRWIHARAEPLFDEHGKVMRWYALLVDVDDRRNAEDALRASQAELAHVTRVMTMGELVASIAHEVSQPLTVVVNNANACLELLPRGSARLEEVREALAEIIDDADRASTVITRVRQLATKAPSERALLNVRDLVADILALARHESVTRRVTIRTELSDDLPLVMADRVQLQQVLLNLMVNGMDAMGTVEESKRLLTIRVRRETRDGIPEAVVSVQDAGIGFTKEQMSRLFDAFYTTKAHGMGMGLAISRSIITAHWGQTLG
jgi:PAS domain S-box-containing protein